MASCQFQGIKLRVQTGWCALVELAEKAVLLPVSFPSIYFTKKISSILRIDDDTVLVPKRRRLNKQKKIGLLFSWSTSSSNKLVVFLKPSQVNIPCLTKSPVSFFCTCASARTLTPFLLEEYNLAADPAYLKHKAKSADSFLRLRRAIHKQRR